MCSKTIYYHQILENGSIERKDTLSYISPDSKYIVREEEVYPCSSYTHSDFFFVDVNDSEKKIEWKDAELSAVRITGYAADYQLALELLGKDGKEYRFAFHDDIRYNMSPLMGPKAFKPKYSQWDKNSPLKLVVECMEAIEELGVKGFDAAFKLQQKLWDAEYKNDILSLNYHLMVDGLKGTEVLEFKEGVEKVEPYAFEDLPSLKTIILPSTIKVLEHFSLCCCEVDTIVCKSSVPPEMEWFMFGERCPIRHLTVHIPRGTRSAYEDKWKFAINMNQITLVEFNPEQGNLWELPEKTI